MALLVVITAAEIGQCYRKTLLSQLHIIDVNNYEKIYLLKQLRHAMVSDNILLDIFYY